MRLKAAKIDAQILANRLKGVWLIVLIGKADYKIVSDKEATRDERKKARVRVTARYELTDPKARKQAFKMRCSRAKKKANES